MNVLMLNYEFPPLGGGAANANFHILKEFKNKKNLKIHLVTSSASSYGTRNLSKNIKIHFLDIGKKGENLHYQSQKDLLVYAYKSYFYSKKLMKENDFGLIHAWFGIPSGAVAMLLGKPYIVSLRGSDVPFYNERFKLLDTIFFQHLSRLVWKKARYVVTNSRGLKDLAKKTSPKQKFEIIPNGVDTDSYKPSKKIKKKNAILYVGRMIPRKGVDDLLQSFAKLEKDIKENWEIWLAGDGPEMENLMELGNILNISSQVKFLGRLEKKELLKRYQSAKIFVLPSNNEGMSNAVLEAMSCGLPIIITSTGGTKELVDKNNGIIVPKNNVYKLSQALKELTSNTKKRNSMSTSSRKKAEKMSWHLASNNYYEMYTK